MTRLEQKKEFIKQLAMFLEGNLAAKSISLQMPPPPAPLPNWPQEWSALRSASPLRGWNTTVGEAQAALEEFLL